MAVETVIKALNRGIDKKSPGHLVPDGFSDDLRNVRLTSGVPEKIGGFTPLFSTVDNKPPDSGNVLYALQQIIGGTRLFVVFTSTGRVYTYSDGTSTFLLNRRIPTGATGWASAAFGSTRIITDGLNVPYRLDPNGRVVPLPDKRLLGFEANETWSIGPGVTDNGADTRTTPIAFVEGTQGRSLTFSAGTTGTLSNSAQGPFDILTSPYSVAPTFGTADPGLARVMLRVYVNGGAANYTSGYTQFGDLAGANYIRLPWPSALAAGENLLVLTYSSATFAGTMPTTSAAQCLISVTVGAGGTLGVTLDDLRVGYVNGAPAGTPYLEVHKSVLFTGGLPALLFRAFFSNPNNPSYFTPTDTLDVFDKIVSDTRIGIRAFKSFFDTLIVGTRNTIFGITGSDRNTFVLSELATGRGITDHRSIVSYGDTFLYRFRNRLYAYSVSQLQAISLPIEPLMDGYDDSQPMVALPWIRHNLVLWTYVTAGGTPRLLVWDAGSGARAWEQWDMPATAVFPYVDTAGNDLVLTLHADGILYLQDQGGQFNGADFDAIYQSRWLGAEQAAMVKKWLRAYLHIKANAGDSVFFAYRLADDETQFDGAAWSPDQTLTSVSFGEGTFADIGETARYMQFKLRHSSSSTVYVAMWPWGFDPYAPIPVVPAGFTAGQLVAFQVAPPLTVESYPLPARRA